MPRVCGPAATRSLRTGYPMIRVLMVSASTSPQSSPRPPPPAPPVTCEKGGDTRELVTAVRTVAAGGTNWPGVLGPVPGY